MATTDDKLLCGTHQHLPHGGGTQHNSVASGGQYSLAASFNNDVSTGSSANMHSGTNDIAAVSTGFSATTFESEMGDVAAVSPCLCCGLPGMVTDMPHSSSCPRDKKTLDGETSGSEIISATENTSLPVSVSAAFTTPTACVEDIAVPSCQASSKFNVSPTTTDLSAPPPPPPPPPPHSTGSSAPSITAASRVAGVAELLEQILLNLDESAIFRAVRVNRTFKATVDGSPSILRKLWLLQTLKADEQPKLNPNFAGSGGPSTRGSLLLQDCLPGHVQAAAFQFAQQLPHLFHPVLSSPALKGSVVVANPGLFDLKGGTWERMLVASGSVTLRLRWCPRSDDCLGWVTAARPMPFKIHCEQGATIGQLVKMIKRAVSTWDGYDR